MVRVHRFIQTPAVFDLAQIRDRLVPESEHVAEVYELFAESKRQLVLYDCPKAYVVLSAYAHKQIVNRKRKDIASLPTGITDFARGGFGLRKFSREMLAATHRVYQGVEIVQDECWEYLTLKTKGLFTLIDPPYWMDNRDSYIYQHVWELEDYIRLVELVRKAKHRVMVTLGDCELTQTLFSDFRMRRFYLRYNNATGKTIWGTEYAIMNYDDDDRLLFA